MDIAPVGNHHRYVVPRGRERRYGRSVSFELRLLLRCEGMARRLL